MITPSNFYQIKQCNARVLYKDDGGLIPVHPQTIFGKIVHVFFQNVYNVNSKSDLYKIWNESEKKILKDENHEINKDNIKRISLLIDNFSSRKHQLIQNVFANICNEKKNKVTASREISLEYNTIIGIPDLVIDNDNEISIIDFKTGLIFDEYNEVKESYQIQLKIYAGLYFKVYKKNPDKLFIVHNDCYIPINFTQEQCSTLLDNLVDLKERLLRVSDKEINNYENPNKSYCYNCSKRLSCDSYWDSDANLYDLRGVLKEVKVGLRTKIIIGENIIISDNNRINEFVSDYIGKEVVFLNLKNTDKHSFETLKYSVLLDYKKY
jgi:hypothetical protein